jgi:hypothetical protein
MTVIGAGADRVGRVQTVTCETASGQLETEVELSTADGVIAPNLRLGASTHETVILKANQPLSFMGVKLVGEDFVVDAGKVAELGSDSNLIRPFLNGRDVTQSSRNTFVIDTFGVGVDELRTRAPSIYQHLIDRVKPRRDARRGKSKDADEYAARWWQHAKPRPDMRKSLAGLQRLIVTSEVAKHRILAFVDSETLADGALIVIALSDAFFLGTLSSRAHVVWSLASGGRMGVGNDPRYSKTRCFDPFPFPVASESQESQESRIRELAEQLDGHRKRQQAQHPKLTMTGMYNVLEKLRADEPLTDKDKTIHEQGLVSVLKQIHNDLDAAVFEAYGWPVTLTDEEILERLVVLNAERAAEEQHGLIRWLRPEFQNPDTSEKKQKDLAIAKASDEPAKATKKKAARKKKLPLPSSLPEQVVAIRQQLATSAEPLTAADMAKRFSRAKADRMEELLQSLTVLGSAREVDGGKYVSA